MFKPRLFIPRVTSSWSTPDAWRLSGPRSSPRVACRPADQACNFDCGELTALALIRWRWLHARQAFDRRGRGLLGTGWLGPQSLSARWTAVFQKESPRRTVIASRALHYPTLGQHARRSMFG